MIKRIICFLTKTLVQLAFGGGLYYGIEVLFRLFRHHTPPLPHVFFLGGIAYILCRWLCRIPLKRWARMLGLPLLGGVVLTGYEYLFGWYFLTTQNLRIWNYTGCPLEYRGLICFQFSLCWLGAMLFVMILDYVTEEKWLCGSAFAYKSIFRHS